MPDPAPAAPSAGTPAGATAAATTESTWVTASTELRTTAKWVITSLAAVATVVFGAGPIITRPTLDPSEDLGQILLAFVLGVAGLVGIGILIASASKVLLPVEMSLDDLPPELLDKIEKQPASLLPGDIEDLEHFRSRLSALRRSVVEIPETIEDLEREADAAQRANDAQRYDESMGQVAAYQDALEDNTASLATYEAIRSDLVDRGAFTKLSTVFSRSSRALWAGALLAGIGGLGFQLALTSAPDDGGGGGGGGGSAAEIGVLTHQAAGRAFWTKYDLESCETSPGKVPVLVTGGDGTSASPWTVQTIPDRLGSGTGCPALSFSARPEAFSVAMPVPDTITIESDDG